jgi:LysM repeat protein
MAHDISSLSEENDMLRARLEDIEAQLQGVSQEAGRTRQDALREVQQGTQAAGERVATTERRLQELEKRLTEQDRRLVEMDAARKKDLQVMQDRILTEISGLLQEQERRSSSRSSSGTAAVAGPGEHIVAAGESLSVIARTHGTSTQKLMELNNLTNPNQVRAGQKLRVQ